MLKTNKKSRISEQLRAARSVQELLKIISVVGDSVHELDKSADAVLTSVSTTTTVTKVIEFAANAATELELGDMADLGTKARLGKTRPASNTRIPALRTVLDNYTTPDLKVLTRDNKALELLSQNIAELEVAEQVLLAGSLSDLTSSKKALEAVRAIKSEAQGALNKQLLAMSKIAKKTKPKQHLGITNACVKHLESILDKKSYSGMETKTFIYVPEKNKDFVHYQTYIFVENFMNADNAVYDSYAFVVTGVLDTESGELHHAITSIKDQLIPGSFSIGQIVETPAELKRRINTLLSLDSFEARRERRVIPHSTQSIRNSTLSDAKHIGQTKDNGIKLIRVYNDEIFVRLDPGLTDSQEKETIESIKTSLYQIFRTKSGATRSSIHMVRRTSRKDGRPILIFSIIPDGTKAKIEVTNNKLKQIADSLQLSERQIARFREVSE